MMQGKVVDVTTRSIGAEVVADSTGTLVLVDNAAPFDEDGGELSYGDVTVAYVSADPEADAITLAEPLTVLAGDRVDVAPARQVTEATVRLDEDDDAVVARVRHSLKARLVDGVREADADTETVLLDWMGGTLEVVEVLGRDGSQSWGDPDGTGAEIGDGGYAIRDTLIVDGLSVNGDAHVAGVPLLGRLLDGSSEIGWLDRMSAGVVARQSFSSTAPSTGGRPTGEEWGYAALRATLRGGRLYRLSASVEARANVVGGNVVVRLRAGVDGDATLSSPVEGRVDLPAATSVAHTPQGYCEGFYGTSADADVEMMVTYQGAGGATPQMYSAELAIEDVGPQGSYGGGSYKQLAPASTSDPAPPPPPPAKSTKREYTTMWAATSSATYRGNGQRRTDSPDLVQGYNSYNGIGSSAIVFGGAAYGGMEAGKTLGEAITSAASITRAEVYLYFDHWYASTGGTARISNLGGTSIPATLPASSVTPTVGKSGWRRREGMWVSVPTAWFTDPSASRGIVLGGGGSRSSIYYGRALSHTARETTAQPRRPRLRLTYVR